jgi:hypothetical protein
MGTGAHHYYLSPVGAAYYVAPTGLKHLSNACSHGSRRGLLIFRPSGAENMAGSYTEFTLREKTPTLFLKHTLGLMLYSGCRERIEHISAIFLKLNPCDALKGERNEHRRV